MHEPRFYRQNMGERFKSILFRYLETDIWVAFDNDTKYDLSVIKSFISEISRSLRNKFDKYIDIDPEFRDSLMPYSARTSAPSELMRLSNTSRISGVGPMAGIAGLFAEEIGKACKKRFDFKEIIVENGGDDYIDVIEPINVRLYAGKHRLSNKIILQIEPSECPLGLCSSSGKFGHSKSFGTADLVSVACKDPVLADQLATYFANRINSISEIEIVLKEVHKYPEVLHIAIFKDDNFGITGSLKMLSL